MTATTLGTPASYSFGVFDRVTNAPLDLGSTVNVAQIVWQRRRAAVSTATVVLAQSSMPDLKRVAAHPRRHNLAIWRDAVQDPVWVGPIYACPETRAGVSLQAEDLLSWLNRRTLAPLGASLEMDVADLAKWIITTAFTIDPPVRTGLVVQAAPIGKTKTVDEWSGIRPLAQSELRRLTSDDLNIGAAGFRVFIWPTTDVTRLPSARVSADHMSGDLAVTPTSVDQASVVWARADGLVVPWPPNGRPDDQDGLIEIVIDSTGDTAALRDAARTAWELRRAPTIDLGLGGSITLLPTFPLPIEQLVGGARIATAAPPDRNLTAQGVFELDTLNVTVGAVGAAPRDAGSGRFTAVASAGETVTASWAPVPGLVSL